MKHIVLIAFLALGLNATGLAVAQDGPAFDLLAAPPEQVVIERVDLESGLIVIGGQAYSLYDGDTSMFALPPEAGQRSLNPRLLRAGMEVMVVTDGTEPSRDHRPSILAIWRPQ